MEWAHSTLAFGAVYALSTVNVTLIAWRDVTAHNRQRKKSDIVTPHLGEMLSVGMGRARHSDKMTPASNIQVTTPLLGDANVTAHARQRENGRMQYKFQSEHSSGIRKAQRVTGRECQGVWTDMAWPKRHIRGRGERKEHTNWQWGTVRRLQRARDIPKMI